MSDGDYPYNVGGDYDEFGFNCQLPEHKLLRAVVMRAILDFRDGYEREQLGKPFDKTRPEQENYRTAKTFFRSRRRTPFSFWWISEHVAQDPAGFRQAILRFVDCPWLAKNVMMIKLN